MDFSLFVLFVILCFMFVLKFFWLKYLYFTFCCSAGPIQASPTPLKYLRDKDYHRSTYDVKLEVFIIVFISVLLGFCFLKHFLLCVIIIRSIKHPEKNVR